ncbi:dethiobiotin synthase [Corallincola platygyrae]|uniref:ATP-dependent dethiobiotin synthetase BioD n=1 Tax=Corallincola platygyrae TaxID=1193278 RepID=A0ABW4XJI9_9GAMM
MKTFFVTGTDTDAGKTYVSCALIRLLIDQGLRVSAFKPVAAGAEWLEGQLKNDDALALLDVINVKRSYDQVNPVCFETPASPHLAAKLDNGVCTLSTLESHYANQPNDADACLVEGAGGWLVPVNDEELLSTLPVSAGWDVVLVVGMKLGCLNHALLTAQQIQADGGQLVGWVANSPSEEMPLYRENVTTLQRMISAPLLGEVGYRGRFLSTPAFDSLRNKLG